MEYNFSDSLKEQIWEKGLTVENFDADIVRKDCCGAWIMKEQYGNRDNDFGWEIDHVYPISKGGGDDLENLRPMNWKNNAKKGDDYPHYEVAVSASGNKNIEQYSTMTVNSALQDALSKLYKIK